MADLQVKDIAVALCKGNIAKYGRNEDEANELIKRAILKAGGCEDGYDFYTFKKNEIEVFRILSEIMTETTGQTIIDQYQSWVDVKDIALGDTYEYETMDESLFEVGYVADGTHDISRQRLFKGKLKMETFQLGVKIYEEFDSYRMGRIDFPTMIDRVSKSIDAQLMRMIVRLVEASYDDLGANYKQTGSYDDDKMLALVQRTEAKTGKKCAIYGTKVALANLRKSSSATWSDEDKRDVRNGGYVGSFFGTSVVEIPQTLMANDDDFVVSNEILWVIPEGTKIIKLLFEGDAYVWENTSDKARKDMQIEYEFMRKCQLACIKSNIFSMYKITA